MKVPTSPRRGEGLCSFAHQGSMSTLALHLYRRGAALLAGRGLRRYRWVNQFHALVLRHVKAREATVLGHRMRLDTCDSLELSIHGIYEPAETRFVEANVPRGGCVLDIGANIGYYTLLFARAVGPAGRVFAFEPEPENFDLLRQNVRSNGYENVRMENLAVADENGWLNLF